MTAKRYRAFFYSVFIVLTIIQISAARTVSNKEALSVAESFLQKSLFTHPGLYLATINSVYPLSDETAGRIIGYIVTFVPKGFVVISGDTKTEPIIAYSFSQKWTGDRSRSRSFYDFISNDLTTRTSFPISSLRASQNAFLWKQVLNGRMALAETHSFKQWPDPGLTGTSGWVATTWHQGAPYNQFCPIDPSTATRSYVGCVATAIAQILNYHRNLDGLNFSLKDRYTYGYPTVHIDQDSTTYQFPSFPRLDSLLETIRRKYASDTLLNDRDAAALSYACAIGVQMTFSSEQSGAKTSDVIKLLKGKLSYHADVLQYDDASFFKILRANMVNGLPVQIAIKEDDEKYRHSAVVDGYNTDGFYHINFGWGDSQPDAIREAWYRIPEGMGAGYDIVDYAVVNIQPQGQIPFLLSASADTLHCDVTPIGQLSAPTTVTLTNTDTLAIRIDYLTATDHFLVGTSTANLSDSTESLVLLPNESRDFSVACLPNHFGLVTGELVVSADSGRHFLLITLFGYGVPLYGTTINPGPVWGTWKKANSPYYVCGDISIDNESKLVVEPGVHIVFGGPYTLTIGSSGQLIASGTLADSIFFESPDETRWGGLVFQESGDDDTLDCCTISRVETGPNRGTITVSSSSPVITRTRIYGNRAAWGGALFLNHASPILKNLLIHDNEAKKGGGIAVKSSRLGLTNLAIVANRARESGGAFYLSGDSDTHIKNSIIQTNEAVTGSIIAFGGVANQNEITFSFCDIDTSSASWMIRTGSSNGIAVLGPGNISVDAKFTNGSGRDFRLSPGSPCIDAGDPMDDVGKEPFPHGYRINMGAYGGTALAARTSNAHLTVAPLSLDFGEFHSSGSRTLELALKNGCDQTIHITSLTFTDSIHFSITDLNPEGQLTLNPGDAVRLNVRCSVFQEIGTLFQETLKIETREGGTTIVPLVAKYLLRGNIKGRFTKDHGPYHVTGDIRIVSDDTLIIEPGVTLLFDGPYIFSVHARGVLKAIGSERDSIRFLTDDDSPGWSGFRFAQSGSDDTLAYCIISGIARGPFDDASKYVFKIESTNLMLDHCHITHNQVGAEKLLECLYSDIKLSHCRIDNNDGRGTSLLNFSYSNSSILHALIVNNTNRMGDILNGQHSNLFFNNVTFCNNQSGRGDLFHLQRDTFLNLTNSIVWGNTAPLGVRARIQDGKIAFQYSNIDTASSMWSNRNYREPLYKTFVQKGPGVLCEDPLFSELRNFHLKSDSPCIDAGDPADAVGDEPFPHGYRINMGAYGGTKQATQTSLPSLTVVPPAVDFGILFKAASRETTIYVMNGGPTSIHVTAAVLSDSTDFSIIRSWTGDNGATSLLLSPGQVDSIILRFDRVTQKETHAADLIVQTAEAGQIIVPIKAITRIGSIIHGGVISGTLTRAGSPYYVFGDITIPENERLIIEPGVKLKFMGHYHLSIINGAQLLARGTFQDSVVFCADDVSIGWDGIIFRNSGDDDTLSYCVFKDGKSLESGGALRAYDSSPAIFNTEIKHNYSKNDGGAFYFERSSAILKNVLVHHNQCDQDGGAFACKDSHLSFANATISENTSIRGIGGAFDIRVISTCVFRNCIIWANHNSRADLLRLSRGSRVEWIYSDIDTLSNRWLATKEVTGGPAGNILWGRGVICVDPQFMDADKCNFRLGPNSPCIDAGNSMDGVGDEPFPNGYRINQGAFGGTLLAASTSGLFLTIAPDVIDFGDVSAGTSPSMTVRVKNGSTGSLHITRIVSSDTIHFPLVWRQEPAFSLYPGEIDSFRVIFNPQIAAEDSFSAHLTISSQELGDAIILCRAQTRLGTRIPGGATAGVLEKAKSPYNIYGELQVRHGETLRIEPGVTLRFMGPYGLRIDRNAQLLAIGTAKDSIKFIPCDTSTGWLGILFYESSHDDTLSFCQIKYEKSQDFSYSAISAVGSAPYISHSEISHNASNRGGAICLNGSNARLENLLVYKNRAANSGGAIYCADESPVFKNLTITNNWANSAGGAIYAAGSCRALFRNCIIWNNATVQRGHTLALSSKSNRTVFDHCDVDTLNRNWLIVEGPNPKLARYGTITWQGQNLAESPQFTAPSMADYTLSAASPCIDAGNPNDDFGQEPFPNGYCINMGAYGGTERAAKSTRPKLTASPTPLDFGDIGEELTGEKFLYLKNGTPGIIHINNMAIQNSDHFSLSSHAIPIQLQSGEIDSILIHFSTTVFSESLFTTRLYIDTHEVGRIEVPLLARLRRGTRLDGGAITGILYKDKSPYNVVGDLFVPKGKVLRIEPGVVLKFWGHYSISVNEDAQFLAMGTVDDSIRFCAADTSTGWGGVQIENSASDDTLTYCVLTYGKKQRYGGALMLNSSNTVVRHSRISHCQASWGGGAIAIVRASPCIEFSLINHNRVPYFGSGIYGLWASAALTNLTVTQNAGLKMCTAGIFLSGSSTTYLRNSIIWDDGGADCGAIIAVSDSAALMIEFSDLDLRSENAISEFTLTSEQRGFITWGDGNLSIDPEFSDPAHGDFTLSPSSPCVDAGRPDSTFWDIADPDNPEMALFPSHNQLRNDMGAYGGGGIYISPVIEGDTIPETYALQQNYPNPFNSQTTIEFSLPRRVYVRLIIYNILGQHVLTLMDAVREAGRYSVHWNGMNWMDQPVAGGVYLYRLQAGDYVQTRKMILLK